MPPAASFKKLSKFDIFANRKNIGHKYLSDPAARWSGEFERAESPFKKLSDGSILTIMLYARLALECLRRPALKSWANQYSIFVFGDPAARWSGELERAESPFKKLSDGSILTIMLYARLALECLRWPALKRSIHFMDGFQVGYAMAAEEKKQQLKDYFK